MDSLRAVVLVLAMLAAALAYRLLFTFAARQVISPALLMPSSDHAYQTQARRPAGQY